MFAKKTVYQVGGNLVSELAQGQAGSVVVREGQEVPDALEKRFPGVSALAGGTMSKEQATENTEVAESIFTEDRDRDPEPQSREGKSKKKH